MAYDSDELREELESAEPVGHSKPPKQETPVQLLQASLQASLAHRECVQPVEGLRRIATRYDRLALNYLASVCLAAALVWWI